jgi:phospholipid/cholesterol/gamma-HCH transport system substrate-binding protein
MRGRGVTVIIAAALLGGGAARAAEPSLAETAAGVRALTAPIDHLDIRFDAELAQSLPRPGTRASVSIELAPRPDTWYAVGVATVPAPATETLTVSSTGEVTHTVTSTDNSMVLSVRLFKRLGPVVLSGGVFENHAAVGLELRGFRDRLRVGAVASERGFTVLREPGRLRVGGSVQWRWIYLQAGVDEALVPALRTAYLGVGMRWSDPDIKSVLPWVARARG